MPRRSGEVGRPAVTWLDAPEEHDYPAAASYLAPVSSARAVEAAVAAFRAASATFKAKDILRAARHDLLLPANPHVASDLGKIRNGRPLSPVLPVRFDLATGTAAQIADGYHRVCAGYLTDENTDIPVRIIDVPEIR